MMEPVPATTSGVTSSSAPRSVTTRSSTTRSTLPPATLFASAPPSATPLVQTRPSLYGGRTFEGQPVRPPRIFLPAQPLAVASPYAADLTYTLQEFGRNEKGAVFEQVRTNKGRVADVRVCASSVCHSRPCPAVRHCHWWKYAHLHQ